MRIPSDPFYVRSNYHQPRLSLSGRRSPPPKSPLYDEIGELKLHRKRAHHLKGLAAVLAFTFIFFALSFHRHSSSPSTSPPPFPARPLPLSTAQTTEERLLELNANYDPEQDGFGVGSVDPVFYRNELRDAHDVLLGGGFATEEEVEDCSLDWRCPEEGRAGIPRRLFMTDAVIHPPPKALKTWEELSPELAVNLLDDEGVEMFVRNAFPNGTIYEKYRALPLNILRYDLFRLLALFSEGGTSTIFLKFVAAGQLRFNLAKGEGNMN